MNRDILVTVEAETEKLCQVTIMLNNFDKCVNNMKCNRRRAHRGQCEDHMDGVFERLTGCNQGGTCWSCNYISTVHTKVKEESI
jgi:hypothetical protein